MHNPVCIGVVGSYSYRSISTTLEIIDVVCQLKVVTYPTSLRPTSHRGLCEGVAIARHHLLHAFSLQ